MKQKVKIESSEQFNDLLSKFKEELSKRIPYSENCLVQYHQVTDPSILMTHGGNCLMCELQTESSGSDKYLMHIDNNSEVGFVRYVGKGDKL